MTINQLTTFLEIAEKGNFTAAAGTLGYAQSTVTTQIKQLEDELGTELFDRLGKTVTLTSAGERLLEYARKMQQLERDILTEVPAGNEPGGVLKLGVSESLCYNRFPHILMEYKKMCPKVDVRLQFITLDTFPALLKNGTLDMVYTLNPLIERDDLTTLYKAEESLGFYSAPAHPIANKKGVTEADLAETELLLTSHNCSFRKMLLADFEKTGITPRVSLETSSKEILKQFAANALGVAFIPDMSAEEEVKKGSLVRLDWKGNEFPIYSQLIIHKDKHMSPAMKRLSEILYC